MSNSAQDPSDVSASNTADTPMDTQEKLEKGKGKVAEADVMEEDDEDDDDSPEEGEDAEPEEADEDNMEEIDMDNIVGSRTRGKNIDYAEAAKNFDDEDEDDEDDEDFQDEDMMED